MLAAVQRSAPGGAHEAADCEVGEQYANRDVGAHLHCAVRVRRRMKSCPCLPRGRSHRDGDEREEHACHLQPHDARKPHNRRHQRTLRLLSCCLHRLPVGNASRPGRCPRSSRRYHLPRWTRRLAGCRIRGACGFRRLHQRLCGVPSPISQRPSEPLPIHNTSLRVCGPSPVAKRIADT